MLGVIAPSRSSIFVRLAQCVFKESSITQDDITVFNLVIGECDLPVLLTGGHVKDDSFSASGFLSRNYEPYQARIDNHLPWCDQGTRNEAYLQVDLGGPLKILGVATKGHRQHWESWVSSYKVLYSMDGVDWKYAIVSGNMVSEN